jgi:hypothetical protein
VALKILYNSIVVYPSRHALSSFAFSEIRTTSSVYVAFFSETFACFTVVQHVRLPDHAQQATRGNVEMCLPVCVPYET